MTASQTTRTAPHLSASLALLATAQLIFSLDLNIVFVALPDIGADLGFSGQTLQWVVGAYAVAAGGFLLLGGRLADLLGKRRVFVAALVLYAVSSLAGGLATSAPWIVAARAAQGLGGALLLPSTLALIGVLFAAGRDRNRALAVWGGAGASGLTVGALLGGVLTGAFGWPAVFFVNVPLAGAVAVLALVLIPADGPADRSQPFDLPGALTGTLGVTLLVFALVQAPDAGWTSALTVGPLLAAIALLATFTAIEARTKSPLLPLGMLRNRHLAVGVATTFTYMGTFGALPYFLTTYFQDGKGWTALETGLAFVVPALAIAAGTQVGEPLTTRIGGRTALLIGWVTGILGTAALAALFTTDTAYGWLVPALVVSGVGQGITWTAMFITAGTGVPPEHDGVAAGLATTTLNLGNAVGLALLIALAAEATGRTAIVAIALGLVVGLVLATMVPRRGPAA